MRYQDIVKLVKEHKEDEGDNKCWYYTCQNEVTNYSVDFGIIEATCKNHIDDDMSLLDEKDTFLVRLLMEQ